MWHLASAETSRAIVRKSHPALRDTLQSEMSQLENDWKILEGNWYLRDVLLKKD